MRDSGSARGFDRNYRRGAVMGLTVAEAFILLAFCLLLLFSWWQIDTERRSLAVTDKIGNMSDAEKRDIAAAVADGSITEFMKLREAGVDLARPDALEQTKRYTRFMQEEELRRLLEGAAALPPETRLVLADLVEVGENAKILAAATQVVGAGSDPLQQVSDRLAAAARDEQKLVATLADKLGAIVRGAGGAIDSNGTITLPESVLFDIGKDKIKDPTFLANFCGPWIDTLRESGADISELKIEGHASSEGPKSSSADAAYLYNLDLSQRRAQSALTICLDGVEEAAAQNWAREHLAAIGYSSTRQIRKPDGTEDKERSRRVMFSVALDRSKLIEDIGRDLKRSFQPSGQKLSGVPRIIDGDTIEIGNAKIRLYGIDTPEMGQHCESKIGTKFDCGAEARDRLVAVASDKTVDCEVSNTDRYGRLVSRCTLNGDDLGALLVREGFAFAYEDFSDDYKLIGEDAQAQGVGLWSTNVEMPWKVRREP